MDPVAFICFLKRKRLVILIVHMRCYLMHFLFVGWVACVCQQCCVCVVCLYGTVKIRCPILSGMTFVVSRNMYFLITFKVGLKLFIVYVPLRDFPFLHSFNL